MTVKGQERFACAIAAIDAANSDDPKTVETPEGPVPGEWLYSQRMSETLSRFAPDASEVLRIAVHGHHIERWIVPRSDYPKDRLGYLKWRTMLKRHHANRLSQIMADCGYDAEAADRVGSIVRKEALKADPEVQTLEDVICLVFLKHYATDFASGHDDDKVVSIISKTWAKMSEKGHKAALELDLPDPLENLVGRALAEA